MQVPLSTKPVNYIYEYFTMFLQNLAVNHHREDSHSETSGETATSQDSGNGSIETGENHGNYLSKFAAS